MLNSIAHCLQATPIAPDTATFDAWVPRWLQATQEAQPPIDLAIRTAFQADRVAWAFASAYQAALRALVPAAPVDGLLTLCVTEQAGNRPRDIQTRIRWKADGGVLVSGNKRWVMVGPFPTTLLVVGATDSPEQTPTPCLRVVKVPLASAGLSVQHTQATRFVPEVPHCAVDLQNVELQADALLPGDGYLDYMKPFRTLEDVYVAAATLAYLIREARASQWPTDYIERLAAALVAVRSIALQSPRDAVTHILLAGALDLVHNLRAETTARWNDSVDARAERWRRDFALFDVADTARRLRRERAWAQLRTPGQG